MSTELLERLERANEVRSARVRHREALKRAPVDLACTATVAVVNGRPQWALTWSIEKVLLCVPKVGPVQVPRIMKRCGILPASTLGELTLTQREALFEELRGLLRRHQARVVARAA